MRLVRRVRVPLVQTDAEVTVCTLVYREPRWIDWWKEGLAQAKTETRYRTLVLANDPEPKVRESECWDYQFTNDDPDSEHYMVRVYRAWNHVIMNSPTQWVMMMSNDMWGYDYWLDELMEAKRKDNKTLPCSLLVENGHIPSAMPEYVKDLGRTPDTFQVPEFKEFAATLRKPGETESGRLFGPTLFDRQEFYDIGMYAEGYVDGVPADRVLYESYMKAGYKWITVKGSIVAHLQNGEMLDETEYK